MSKKRVYDAMVSDDPPRASSPSAADQDDVDDVQQCEEMELAFAAYNKKNMTGISIWRRSRSKTIRNVCLYTGSTRYEWIPDIPHSPGNTEYPQKWCFILGAFEPIFDWTTLHGIKRYKDSKYCAENFTPITYSIQDAMEAWTGPFVMHRAIEEACSGPLVRLPLKWYARRAVYVVERWLKGKEDVGSFGRIPWKEILSSKAWQEVYPAFPDASVGQAARTYHTYVEFEDRKGNTHKANTYKYQFFSFSYLSAITRQTVDENGKEACTAFAAEERIKAADGTIQRVMPGKWIINGEPKEFPDLYMSTHIALGFLINMTTIRRRKDVVSRTDPDVIYHSPDIDELELIGDYLLALLESDYPSRFRDIPSLPEGISTVQDILYRPDDALGFSRPGEDGHGDNAYNRCEAKRVYNVDPLAVLRDLRRSNPEQAAALEAHMAESVNMAAATVTGATLSSPPTCQEVKPPSSLCGGTTEDDPTKTRSEDHIVEQLSSRWSSLITHFQEFEDDDEDCERSAYAGMDSNDDFVSLGKELMAGLAHYGWLRDIFLALLTEKVGTFAALRWQRLNAHKRDQFSEAIDNLTVRLDDVKEVLRYWKEDDLIDRFDPADPKATERRIRGLSSFVNELQNCD